MQQQQQIQDVANPSEVTGSQWLQGILLLDIRNSFQSCKPLKSTNWLFDTYSVSHNKVIASLIDRADVDASTSYQCGCCCCGSRFEFSAWNI